MNIDQLYDVLCRMLKNNTLVISQSVCDDLFAHLLRSLAQQSVKVENCLVQLGGGQITVHGITDIPPFSSFGPETFSALLWIENHRVAYEVQLFVNGCGPLKALCSKDGNSCIPDDSLFADFQIQYPVIRICSNEFVWEGGYRISAAACGNVHGRQEIFSGLLPAYMPVEGYLQKAGGQNYYQLDFKTGKNDFALPLGQASVILAMRTMNLQPLYRKEPKVYAYLLFEIHSGRGAGMKFQMEIAPDAGKAWFAAAFFDPVLSIANVETYVSDLFGIPGERLLLPDYAVVSQFGLRKVGLRLKPKGTKMTEGFDIEYVNLVFCLEQPWNTPIQGLELGEFCVIPEMTLMHGQQVTTLTVSAAASLQFGNYRIHGRVKGWFPQQEYEGYLALYQDQEQPSQLSLADLANEFHAPVPQAWAKPLADFSIRADALQHSYELTASASGIISVRIGNLELSIEDVIVHAKVHPAGNEFVFSGVFGFDTGDGRFQFEVDASYDGYWTFAGVLAGGEISIGKLFRAMFALPVAQAAADIVIDGLSVSFSPSAGEFGLFASFGICWFEVLGCRPKLGGRIKILKKQEDFFSASALFYLDIGALHFLVQADDFHTEHIRFLFRVFFHKLYIQGIYSREQGDETVRLSLGGMTFGDLVLAFIHLLNPNAKSYLPSPWNILNKIHLSDFEMVINATQRTAAVLYHVDLSIAGLMQLKDIGIRYQEKEQKISYILTGRLLGQTYEIGNPVSWDAIDGAPPEHTAAAETKTKVSYLGLGSHLQADTSSGSVTEALKKLKEQLKPSGSDVPKPAYSAENGWMFGADATIGDLFRLQMVLIDPALYGAVITVNVTEKSPLYLFNGLALELVYQKISDTVGLFRCCVTLPKAMSRFQLGVLTVFLGQISAEIYTNGSFLIDLGFPHGGDFSKSFGLEYGIFTGRGGIYFGLLKEDAVKQVPEINNGAFTPVVLLGIGLCVGVGRSFDLGIIQGGVSLTVTGILEGAFAVFHPSDPSQKEAAYYRASGVAGIQGTLFLSADWKIIAISVSAEVSAMCSFRIESYRQSVVQVSLYLRLSASIKILFIRISFQFTFQQDISFTFGKDSRAPWELVQERRQKRSLPVLHSMQMFPCVTAGNWNIRVCLLPLFSVKHPDRQSEASYCAAFLCTVSSQDFACIAEMLLAWILAAFVQDDITGEDAAAIQEQAVQELTFEKLDAFFAKNLHITVDTGTDAQRAGFCDGVFFPMLPCLDLTYEETTICYSQNFVTEAYCRKISEYLASLNADPFHEIPKQARSNGSIAMCAAIFTDYFKMTVSQLAANVRRLFQGITMEADSFGQIAGQYDIDAEMFLEANPDILLNISSLSNYTYITVEGDTLHKIQGKYALDARQLWDDMAHISMVPALDQTVDLECSVFDNRLARMTVKEAAAVFFVRLYHPDVIYARYADQLMEDNALRPDWHSERYGSRKLNVFGWSREYTALAGDSVVRIAKAAALVNGGDADGWGSFLERFCRENADGAQQYVIKGTTQIQDQTLEQLLLRICPDFTQFTEKNVLWDQPVISPWKDVRLTGARVELAGVTPVQAGISAAEIAQALQACTADLAKRQSVTVVPYLLTKAQVKSFVLTDEGNAQTGSMVSRFFLQGLRVPAPESGQMVPLFELLRQQIDVRFEGDTFRFFVEKNQDTQCVWTDGVSGREVLLNGEELRNAIPDGKLQAMPVPHKLADFSETRKCWAVTETQVILNNGVQDMLCGVPQDLRMYLEQNSTNTVTLKSAGTEVTDFAWASWTELPLMRTGKNIYRFQGASAQERRELYAFLNREVKSIRLLCRTSRLDTDQAEYAEIAAQSVRIIRSDLSTETHFGKSRSNAWNNLSGIDNPQQFLLLVWEGSVIGGGFWVVGSDIPDSIFDADGKGSLYMLTVFDEPDLCGSYLNRAVLCRPCHSLVFEGHAQRTRVPDFPAGSVGIYADADVSQNGGIQQLFQILGYTVADADGRILESMPILPQQYPDAPEDSDSMFYRAVVPLYRLCKNPESVYAAVGKTFQLEFFRRDVLGNTAKAGTLAITPDYNDFLSDLNQIPFTKAEYLVKNNGTHIQAAVRFCFSAPGQEEWDKVTPAVQAQAERMMQQALCGIEICLLPTFAEQAGYLLQPDEIAAYRSFTKAVYDVLCRQAESCAVPDFEVSFWLDDGSDGVRLPEEIFEIALTARITRCLAKCEDSGVKYAECAAARADGFETYFAKAVPDILLAEGNGKLYGIPKQTYFASFMITPFACSKNGQMIRTPELYAVRPFSTSLVTCSVQAEDTVLTYTDIDMEAWMKRFLEDMEQLLCGNYLAEAAVQCPQSADRLIDAKGRLARHFADRLAPLVKDLSAYGMQTARETALQLFQKSLEQVYRTDVICVYQASYQRKKRCRMESVLNGSDTLHAGKADTGQDFFCMYSSDAGERCSDTKDLELSFLHFEYDVQPGLYGYEDSKWLRLLTPLRPDGQRITADLAADLGIPHPRKLFPQSPVLLSQSCFAEQSALLRYAYTVQVSCKAVEQYTVYLRLRFLSENRSRAGGVHPVFETLAHYDRKREEMFAHISKADGAFANAYGQAADFAGQLCDAMEQTPVSAKSAAAKCREMIFRISFGKLPEAAQAPAVHIEAYGAASREFADRYQIQADLQIRSGAHAGDGLVFDVKVANLPVYHCPQVAPSAWIVQNEDLLCSKEFALNEAFIFRTEEVFLEPLFISVVYTLKESAADFQEAAQKLWKMLEVPDTARPSVTAACSFHLEASPSQYVPLRIPAVFLPEAAGPDEISDALGRWLLSFKTDIRPAEAVFQIQIYGGRQDAAAVSAEVCVSLE